VSSSRHRQEVEEEEDMNEVKNIIKGLYIYPNSKEYLTMMDFDDLNPESLLVLCLKTETENIVYIWKGICFEEVINYLIPLLFLDRSRIRLCG